MNYPIRCDNITDEVEYFSEIVSIYKEAEQYLKQFSWCKYIKSSSLYTNLGSKLCIFLFEIENKVSIDDNFLWIIVGDIPPMYLDIYGANSTREVLEIYVDLAIDWIDNVKLNLPLNDCYPFNVNPTIQFAELLERKVRFIKDEVIDNIDDLQLNI